MKIIKWENVSDQQKKMLLLRPQQENREALFSQVKAIIAQVKKGGDEACYQLTEKYDGVLLSSLRVDEATLSAAEVSTEVAEALEVAKATISRFQNALLPRDLSVETMPGVICQRIAQPLDAVGLYVPGGSAPLVSTLMMLALPAKLAGCTKIVLCTPPSREGGVNPALLYAAKLCGITEVFAVGGAQAIAAMAYGTETIPKVCKIFGPGNAWVTAAKQLVAQDPEGASIDLPAGPSEILIIADETAEPTAVAADLLSQAEHGPDSQVILCTNSIEFAAQVNEELQEQLSVLPRKAIAKCALENSRLFIVNNLSEGLDIAADYAPEHLSLNCENPERWLKSVRNAGTVFCGANAAETFGDYVSGSNHVLPTYGYTRSVSGLSVRWILCAL